jgi:polyferredoxin
LAGEARRRRRKRSAWTRARQGVQALSLVGFLSLFVASSSGQAFPALVGLPFRLDPLAMLAQSVAARALLPASALALLTVVLTLAVGRAWCGWLCPLGTLLDVIAPRRRPARREALEPWRAGKYLALAIVLVGAGFGSLTLLVFDPVTLVYRALASGLWPAADRLVTTLEGAAFRVTALRPPIVWLEGLLRPAVFPLEPANAAAGAGIVMLLGAVLALNWLAPRFWCRALCPLGGLLALLSKVAWIRRQVHPACSGCKACVRACPTDTIRADRGFASDPAECTVCMQCIDGCPIREASFRPSRPDPAWQAYDPGRRQALAAISAGVAGFGWLAAGRLGTPNAHLPLRPPGATNEHLLRTCLRCAACVRACPTGALSPAVTEAGVEGIWSPIFVPRQGYCDYACHACGLVCPVEAIPPLALDVKRLQVIGVARIDRERCLPWAEATDCIVCEEMCPVPEKAIRLEAAQAVGDGGETRTILQPHVVHRLCIGCGICEYRCPAVGEAAIRVGVAAEAGGRQGGGRGGHGEGAGRRRGPDG